MNVKGSVQLGLSYLKAAGLRVRMEARTLTFT